MNERRDLPVVGTGGGTNRISPQSSQDAARPASGTVPPGDSLRDTRYHDLCEFFASYPDGQAWTPAMGDWVYLPLPREVRLVLAVDAGVTPDGTDSQPGGTHSRLQVAGPDNAEVRWVPRDACVWLPTLDQVRILLHDVYGSVGFFTSVFTNTTYWYQGELSGMQVEKMTPLAEGRSPEEAAVKALLMRFQR
ncbi:MAG: hypothetical protein NVSMB65_00920 [Chloroflexota bacterium]